MTMRSCIIRAALAVVTCFSLQVHADDSISVSNDSYRMKVEKYQRFWNSLIPSQLVVQNAGNMGVLSAGIGWNYGKHDQWETHFLVGFVPKYHSKSVKATLTLKENFIPWRKAIRPRFTFEPLSCSFYVNTIFGDEFWSHQPSRYPNNYYWFSTRLRLNVSLGERFTVYIPENKKKWVKSLTLFYEIGSCDLYLIDFVSNKEVAPKEILGLSLGLKIQIF